MVQSILLSVPDIAAQDSALALNTALVRDGAVVYLPSGVRPTKPIEIVHVATGAYAVYATASDRRR